MKKVGRKPKLPEDIVLDIMAKYSTVKYTQQELAIQYGVSQGQISYIVNKGYWKQVRISI